MFKFNSKRRRPEYRFRRLAVESLEGRQMLSATPVQLISHAGEFSGAGQSYIDGQQQAISADGRYVAFVSKATNLVDGLSTMPGVANVYRYDRVTGGVDLVSVNAAGGDGGNGDSRAPTISADGSIIAFASVASDLSPLDTNGSVQDVFIRNFTANVTRLVSLNFASVGSGNGASDHAVVSANGRVVAFDSAASDLSPLDTNGSTSDVFARDLTTNVTTLMSINEQGNGSGNNGSSNPVICADGTVVAFESLAGNLKLARVQVDVGLPNPEFSTYVGGYSNIFSRNLTTNTTTMVSQKLPIIAPYIPTVAGIFWNPAISADGKVVAFDGFEATWRYDFFFDQLVVTPSPFRNVYVQKGAFTNFTLVSANATNGQGGNGDSFGPVLSADGSVVAYESYASNLTPLPDANGALDVFVRNFANPTYISALVSVNAAGTSSGNGPSGDPVISRTSPGLRISADGNIVAFESAASDLAALDANGSVKDVFVRNLTQALTRLISVNANGVGAGNAQSGGLAISADGQYVAFTSDADDLVAGDNNGVGDAFLVDLGPHSVVRLDGNGALVLSDYSYGGPNDDSFGGKNDNLRISYDADGGDILIEDLNGDPIVSTVGSGSGTSVVQVNTGDFAGDVIVNSGVGDDRLTLDPSFVNSGKQIQFDGGTGTNLITVPLAVNPATINSDLQNIVSFVRGSTTNALPPQVTMNVSSLNLVAVASAIQSLVSDTSGSLVDVVLQLSGGGYSGQSLNVPSGVRLEINGTAMFTVGTAPGLKVQSGDVRLIGLTASSTIDAPTILVSGGSVFVRNSTIRETSAGDRAAVEVAGGSADLGTSGSSGGNTFDASGPGQLVRNVSSQSISGLGNTYKVDGTTLTSAFAIEDRIYHGTDTAGRGVVYYIDHNLYATISSGSIQRAIDAAADNDVVNVQTGLSQDYNADAKLSTIAFQNGPNISQQLDNLNPTQRKLTFTGTPGNDNIAFKQSGEVVEVKVAGLPTGSFKPTSRLIALGLGGDDTIDATYVVKFPVWFDGDSGNDILKGGKANDVLQGGADNDQLLGGGGRDLLIGGSGSDQIGGDGGEDILLSGTTLFDANQAALLGILNEWGSARSYADRVANIMGTGTGVNFAARLNSTYFLNVDNTRGTITVLDDDAHDSLKGGNGNDLYFANLALDAGDQATHLDTITSLKKGELSFDTDVLPPIEVE